LEDAAQWELLFRGEEALWRSAAALRAAGYGSVLSLTREPIHDRSSTLDANKRVPLLTREPESRGAKHIRMLIPRGIQGVTEEDRIALQAWFELADWTGKDLSLQTSGQMRERMSIHPSGLLKQWLVEEESRQGLLRENEPAKLFEECQRKLDRLANLLNTAPALEEADEVESIPGGAVLGAALIACLKETEVTVEVAKKVVGTVWPELCGGQSQRHPTRITSCVSKTTLADNVEDWTRTNQARCPQHLTLLRYVCPWCKSRLCTECNEAKEQKECPFEEVTDARKSSRSQKEGENLEFRESIRGWAEKSKRFRCTYLM
jgi:hypothetical protein